jgi:hypothetical protein
MRSLRRALIAAVIAVVALVGVDVGSRLFAQDWVAGQLQESLQLSREPSVSFGGLVFLPGLVSGDVPSVRTSGRTFVAEGVEFEEITLNLRRVTYSPRQLITRAAGTIRAREGEGFVTMTDRQLTEAFRARGAPVDVRFEDGVVRVSADVLPGSVGARVTVEGGDLVVRPADVPLPISFTLDLPEFIDGLTYTAVDIRNDIGRLDFALQNVQFNVDASRG